jgi:hypothetical protein
MQITKSDFLKYLQCPEYFWMTKYKPESLNENEIDPFVQQIIDQGNEVEAWARKLFPRGVMISSWKEQAIEDTRLAINEGAQILFQPSFQADGLKARIDVLERTEKGWNFYEVKGTTSKQKKKAEHYWDAIFQREVMTRAGYEIENIYLVELNKDFIKDGVIAADKLLDITNITEDLQGLNEEVRQGINLAKAHLAKTLQPSKCNCHLKSRKNQCPAFKVFNSDFPAYAVHDLARVSATKLSLFDDIDVVKVDDIPQEFELTAPQYNQVWTHQNDETVIKLPEICKHFGDLNYPLYFLDYETYPAAVPVYDGCRPFQQVPFQYSLHILDAPDGEFVHKEFLQTDSSSPIRPIALSLCNDIGDQGSVIVWNRSFEKKCNEDLALMNPDLSDAILNINSRLYDLMEIFSKQFYVHKKFKGRSSIKKVLPVICPKLSYDGMGIANGGAACSSWKKMVFDECSLEEQELIKKDLLEYCKLDTWAMVRIWQEMNLMINKG